MNVIYNTPDNVYIGEDMMHAFKHAYNLGQSDWDGDVDQAYKEFVGEYTHNNLKDPTIERIAKAVADTLGTSTFAITNQDFGKGEKIANARLLCCWFMYLYIDDSLTDVSEYLGYKNHSSVIYGAGRVNFFLETDAAWRTTVNLVKARILYEGFKLEYKPRLRLEVEYNIVD